MPRNDQSPVADAPDLVIRTLTDQTKLQTIATGDISKET
jgi:hypothetical protein